MDGFNVLLAFIHGSYMYFTQYTSTNVLFIFLYKSMAVHYLNMYVHLLIMAKPRETKNIVMDWPRQRYTVVVNFCNSVLPKVLSTVLKLL